MTMNDWSEEERAYLESLPAVRRVRDGRIYYERRFRDACVKRYLAGESPVAMFREAGLSPVMIGYKRIERCFARWTEAAAKAAQTQVHSQIQNAGQCAAAIPDVTGESNADESDANIANVSHADDTLCPRTPALGDEKDQVIAHQAIQIARLEALVHQLRHQLDHQLAEPV